MMSWMYLEDTEEGEALEEEEPEYIVIFLQGRVSLYHICTLNILSFMSELCKPNLMPGMHRYVMLCR